MRCRTFNVPKDFRAQFQDRIEEKKDEMKIASNGLKTSMIKEENEVSESDDRSSNKAGHSKIIPGTSREIIPGTSSRLSRAERIELQ